MATGCSNGNSDDLGEEVVVQFGDGEASIYLRNIDVQQTEAGTEITAEVVSELPEVYTFQATAQSANTFEAVLHNGTEISHEVVLNERELNIEFLRPTWDRTESLGFLNAELMDSWLQERVANGTGDCDQIPGRFQDMPLQYVSTAILDYVAATRELDLSTAKMQRILCAEAADAPEGNGLGYPLGLEGWQALIEGRYLPPNLQEKLPEYQPQQATASDGITPKNNCARENKETSVAATFDTSTLGDATTNIDVNCGDSVLELNANCCIDEDLEADSFGTLRKAATAGHPFCRGVDGESGPTQYAEFRFAAHAKICPTAPNSCWGDGVRDTARPFSCTFSGYDNATETPFEGTIGGGEIRKSGVAGWNYLQFIVRTCYESGADADTIFAHIRSIDTNRPGQLICWHDSIEDCYCADGP